MQQTSKAANLVHAALLFRKLLEKEKLKPVSMKDFEFGKLWKKGTLVTEGGGANFKKRVIGPLSELWLESLSRHSPVYLFTSLMA